MEDNKSLVSIIIPTYNRASLLKRAIASCCNQDYENIEVVVVDDSSKDNTAQVVKEYIKQYKSKKITYLKLKKNVGESGARIAGIKQASGLYVAFLDSDDELTCDSISIRVKALQSSQFKAALVYGDIVLNGELRKFIVKKGYEFKYLLKELSLCSPNTILVNRSCFNNNYPSRGFPSWGDDDLVLTVGRKFPILHCGHVVAKQYSSQDSVSLNHKNNYVGCKLIINKYQEDIVKKLGYGRLIVWQIRLFRTWLLYIRQRLINDKPSIVSRIIIFFIHIFLLPLDKFLYLFFDNLFV